jgi:hypothetical protein
MTLGDVRTNLAPDRFQLAGRRTPVYDFVNIPAAPLPARVTRIKGRFFYCARQPAGGSHDRNLEGAPSLDVKERG